LTNEQTLSRVILQHHIGL